MLYLFYGKDTYRSRQKLNEILSVFRSKRSDLALFNFDEQSFTEGSFKELLKSQTLFDEKHAVVCENILEDKNILRFILEQIENIAISQNVFIFLETDVEDKALEQLKEKAKQVQLFDLLTGTQLKKWISKELDKDNVSNIEVATESIIKKCSSNLWCASKEIEKISLGGNLEAQKILVGYNPFAIADAVGERNKRKAWLTLQQARMSGITDEEVFWKIVWQIKTLLLVKKSMEAGVKNLEKETGLHPFVAKKALHNLKNFAPGELEGMSYKAIEFYHKARINLVDFEVGLEKLIIS